MRMPKSKKNQNKAKPYLTVREEQRNKLEQMASLESRSVSNLIEVMADERCFSRPPNPRESWSIKIDPKSVDAPLKIKRRSYEAEVEAL